MTHRAPEVAAPRALFVSRGHVDPRTVTPTTAVVDNLRFLGRAVRSEVTKLSWRNPLFWMVIPLAVIIPVAMNYGIAKATQLDYIDGSGGMDTNNSAYWILLFAPFILMTSAVTSFCGEFKDKTIELGTAIQPRRWTLAIAKLLVFGIISGVTVAVTTFAILWGFPHLFPDIWGRVDLFSASGLRLWLGIPVYTMLVLALGLGISVLVPRPGLVIMGVVLWKFVVELFFPRIANNGFGDALVRYAPFANAEVGVGQYPTFDPPFGPNISLLYFAGIAAVFFVIGLIRLAATDLRCD